MAVAIEVKSSAVVPEAEKESSLSSIVNQTLDWGRSATTAIHRFSVEGYKVGRDLISAEVDDADVGIIAPAAMGVVLGGLFQYANMKSQGKTGFPFDTHPKSVMISVTSLLTYGFAYLAERLFIRSGFHPTSVCIRIARLARIACVYTVIASLAYSLYD